MSSYSLFENPKLGKTLKSIMRYRFGEFKGYDTEAAADVVAEVAEKQDQVDQEVKKKIDDVLEEANNDPDVLESSQAFDLSSKLGNSKPDDTEKPTPKILEQASQYEENKDEAADQECGIASADDMLDIL